MKQVTWISLVAFCAMVLTGVSCHRDVFDEERYEELLDSVCPVDSIDKDHSWVLTTAKDLLIMVPEGMNAEKVQILTANPRQSGDAKLVGQVYVTDGEKRMISISYPSTLATLYAALIDQNGKYTLEVFSPDEQGVITFSNPILKGDGISYEPQPQVYTYCFEEEYPKPGDYDYNDVVMRISQERTGKMEMRYHVTLAAVGASKQVGACLRLVDVKYDDIESVSTVNNMSFNVTNGKTISDQMMYVLTDKSLFAKGRHDEAVLNLFVDAHWATGEELDDNFGMMGRKKYNVTKNTGGTAQMMVPREITYVVTFKDEKLLNRLSLDQLDPFIVEEFNGGRWEVHMYEYRNAQVLYPYTGAKIAKLPWAFRIPSGTFRWPLEGVNIGFIINGSILFGAYATEGHSFGEWAMDRNRFLDWYLDKYATPTRVF
ncbi:LruC domain-containing protein [Prevotella sp. lc2012]|uniref:LruC domain-containing protein n=1 Tax=Prevotella sp. lc2012 TaxID=1761886 RepID=UPI00089C2007|nr:LruC domain-containing protein [Prevotella sp. lc2012]SEE28923.1 LruC domain-containing protein [Prevotella sp. lc2012]